MSPADPPIPGPLLIFTAPPTLPAPPDTVTDPPDSSRDSPPATKTSLPRETPIPGTMSMDPARPDSLFPVLIASFPEFAPELEAVPVEMVVEPLPPVLSAVEKTDVPLTEDAE